MSLVLRPLACLVVLLAFLFGCEAVEDFWYHGDVGLPGQEEVVAPGEPDTIPPQEVGPADTGEGRPDAFDRDVSDRDESAPETVSPPEELDNLIDEGTFLIVAPAEMAEAYEDLADWRRRTGLPTRIVTMEEIDAAAATPDRARALRDYLRGEHERGTEIVLLGGNTPDVPHREVEMKMSIGGGGLFYEHETVAASELYFSDLYGDWERVEIVEEPEGGPTLRPDVAVGRVPAENAAEVAAYVAKVIDYERELAADYQDEVLFISEPTGYFDIDSSLMLDTYTRKFGGGYNIEKLYSDTTHYPDAKPNSAEAQVESLERGVNVILHFGHGLETILGALRVADVEALSHAPRYNVYASCACYSGDFAYSGGRAVGADYILNPEGGGVAYLGNTDVGIGFPPGALFVGDAVWLAMLSETPLRLGVAFAEARRLVFPVTGSGAAEADRYTQLVVVLLGCPALRMWPSRPLVATLAAPPTLAAGDALVAEVSVGGEPVAGAVVTLYRQSELLLVTTSDEFGVARFRHDAPLWGSYDLTVSGAGVQPIESSVTFE